MSGQVPDIVELVHAKRSRRLRPSKKCSASHVSEIQKLQQAIANVVASENPKLAAERLIASCSPATAQLVLRVGREEIEFPSFESPQVSKLAIDAAQWIAGAQNSRKAALEVGFALDVEILEGASQTMIAKVCGRTRASISKNVKNLCKKWGLPPNRGMKSLKACESYRASKLAAAKSKRKEIGPTLFKVSK